MKQVVYIPQDDIRFVDSSQIVVKEVLRQLDSVDIKSVADFGCGIGTWLKTFKDCGVFEVKGFDSDRVDKRLLFGNITPKEFETVDFENIENDIVKKQYSLVLCLEVAEHVTEENSDKLIKRLTQSGNIILFSAAIPYQGGPGHVNEQWPDYWAEKFAKYGFIPYDTIRFRIWNDDRIFSWYKQNILFYVSETEDSLRDLRKKLLDLTPERNNEVKRMVHPECYLSKIQ